jgi:ubiquinone/menaquinone biosynthesis C-methylase UbiE
MNKAYEVQYHLLEEQHWWFAGRRHTVMNMIQDLALPTNAAILEVGCSGGPLLLALQQAGYTHLTGIDVSEEGIALAQRRGFKQVAVMDGARLEFPDNSFDVLVASDVLEHIEQESQALQEWRRVLRPGGHLLVFVPAHQYLWSRHDEVNHHFRRYSSTHLQAVLKANGFQVQQSGYWNNLLYFPTALVRLGQRLLPKKEATAGNGNLHGFPTLLNKSLLALLRLENKLIKRQPLPFGVSLFARATRSA